MGEMSKRRLQRPVKTMVLLVAECSDTSKTLKTGRFYECFKMGHIPSDDGTKDFVVRCAGDLREETFSAGLYSDQAIVNERSLLLMPRDKFDILEKDEEQREIFLNKLEMALSGKHVPKDIENWCQKTNAILAERNMFVDDVMKSVRKAFKKMNLVTFP